MPPPRVLFTNSVLVNVRLRPGQDWTANTRMAETAKRVEAELVGSGRVLIRASGTEPLVRVMVEASNLWQATECAQRIADCLIELPAPTPTPTPEPADDPADFSDTIFVGRQP